MSLVLYLIFRLHSYPIRLFQGKKKGSARITVASPPLAQVSFSLVGCHGTESLTKT